MLFAVDPAEGGEGGVVESSSLYRFDDFTLDVRRCCLTRGGKDIPLRPRSFDVLRYLVEHPRKIVTKDELIASVWAPSVVTDGALVQCIMDLRRALGDQAQHLIRTVPKRGYLLESDVSKVDGDGRFEATAWSRWWISLPLSVVAAMVVLAVGLPNRSPADERPSIAVMPFDSTGERPDQEFLARGFSEEVADLLSEQPDARVISSRSSFSPIVQGADSRTIGEVLGVDYLLSGRVGGAVPHLRFSVHLTEAQSGQKLWSESFTRHRDELRDVQRDLVNGALQALGLDPVSSTGIATRVDAEAYTLYLQARHLVNAGGPDALADAHMLLERSLKLDPEFPEALLTLARVEFRSIVPERSEEGWDRIEALVLQARRLDPNNAGVHSWLGWIARARHRNFAGALAHYERALAEEPLDLVSVLGLMPLLLDLHQLDRAIAFGEYMARSDPLCVNCFVYTARAYSVTGRLEEARDRVARALAINPRSPSALGVAAEIEMLRGNPAGALEYVSALDAEDMTRTWASSAAYLELDRHEDSERQLALLKQRWGSLQPDAVAHAYSRAGNVDAAFEWLGRVREFAPARPAAYHDSRWPALVDDPRWREFQRRLGVAPEQLAMYETDIWPPER